MRNLTIKRIKSFVGCLAKMKVYIEDPTSNEITINDLSCRKLGDLKNGEEKTFFVTENEAKVFVIADKLSKNYCNDFYKLPAGENDLFLSGKNCFNPINGNAFRFDGEADEEIMKNRKKGIYKGLAVLIVAIIIGFIIGFVATTSLFFDSNNEEKRISAGTSHSDQSSADKVFSVEEMKITLTEDFVETELEGFTACYDSNVVGVLVLKEEFSLFEGYEDYTVEQYGDLVLESNSLTSSVKLQNHDGLTYFEYDYINPETNDEYNYFTVLYKSADGFWMIQFATLEENIETYRQSFIDWAKTVKFSKS